MRKWMTFLMALMVGASSYTYANGSIGFEIGYRQDNVNTKTKFGGDLEVRQNFSDLDIFQVGVKGKGNLGCNFYGRAEGTWGWVLDGKYSEKVSTFGSTSFEDYYGSSFSGEFANTTKFKDVVDDRYVFDANVAIGYPFYFCDCTMSIAPVLGYSFDEQNLRLNRGDTEFFADDYYYGEFFPFQGSGCCDQKFINRWYGPFLGFDFEYRPCNECWNIFAEIEFHWAHYKGRSHEGFGGRDVRTHRAHHGHGVVANIGVEYDFCNCWTAALAVKFSDFRAHRNHHGSSDFFDSYSYSSSSGSNNGGDAHFKWRSFAVNLLVGRGF
jgi:hypothetical protein